MFEELKPCPFCGGEAVLHVNNGVMVVCKKCGCRTNTGIDYWNPIYGYQSRSVDEVIEAWNRRAAVNER